MARDRLRNRGELCGEFSAQRDHRTVCADAGGVVALKFATQIALSGAVGLFVLYNNIIDDRFGDVRVCLLRRDAALAPAAPAQANAAAAPAVS